MEEEASVPLAFAVCLGLDAGTFSPRVFLPRSESTPCSLADFGLPVGPQNRPGRQSHDIHGIPVESRRRKRRIEYQMNGFFFQLGPCLVYGS